MAQDVESLLKSLQELTRAAKEPGRLSREQLEAEVRKVTLALNDVLSQLGGQLQATGSPATASLVEVFRSQLTTTLRESGLDVEQTDEMKKLSAELERLKRGFIRS
ncbi:hypothetical protein HPC49_09325 [Pyxidicoccus fallax]|uniref:Uncharacterized protein n=1 Tax=Pyxidicoccus fallax TaxID=394095 RepID=A0A848LEI1_9BACT|nr:hypothetical protein [Pyxidicoccus fallax]NMO14651.1 hypothetical protein [Pyxidicoccus fallax]NPC78442.1 hypothetical protein [Pyxidicoccus fallax]